MRELQKKIIIEALEGRMKEIKLEPIEIKNILEYIFYKEFLSNLDNFREKTQYWDLAEIYFEGEDDIGAYENPISVINSLAVISRIYSLCNYFTKSFNNENIESLYIEGMKFEFQKYRKKIKKWNKKYSWEQFYRGLNKFFYIFIKGEI